MRTSATRSALSHLVDDGGESNGGPPSEAQAQRSAAARLRTVDAPFSQPVRPPPLIESWVWVCVARQRERFALLQSPIPSDYILLLPSRPPVGAPSPSSLRRRRRHPSSPSCPVLTLSVPRSPSIIRSGRPPHARDTPGQKSCPCGCAPGSLSSTIPSRNTRDSAPTPACRRCTSRAGSGTPSSSSSPAADCTPFPHRSPSTPRRGY